MALVANPAVAHFHGPLAVTEHRIDLVQTGGLICGDERFVVGNGALTPFNGSVFAFLDTRTRSGLLGPEGSPAVAYLRRHGVVEFNLSSFGMSMGAGEALAFLLEYCMPDAERGAHVARTIPYDTQRLSVSATPAPGFRASGDGIPLDEEIPVRPGEGGFSFAVVFEPAPHPLLRFLLPAAGVALLVLLALAYDARRRRGARGPPPAPPPSGEDDGRSAEGELDEGLRPDAHDDDEERRREDG